MSDGPRSQVKRMGRLSASPLRFLFSRNDANVVPKATANDGNVVPKTAAFHGSGNTTNRVEIVTAPKQHIRPIRFTHSPTGPMLGSGFSSHLFAHKAVVVGNPDDGEVVISELQRIGRDKISQKTTCVSLPHSAAQRLKEAPIIGYTSMSNSEIRDAAGVSAKSHGTYNLASRNCQHFADKLAQSIIDPTIVEPDRNVQYRFTPYSLKFMSSFAHKGSKSGWILPTGSKILVNVTQTEDPDTWVGQVEGSEEHGMFHSGAVQRI